MKLGMNIMQLEVTPNSNLVLYNFLLSITSTQRLWELPNWRKI